MSKNKIQSDPNEIIILRKEEEKTSTENRAQTMCANTF